MPARLLLLALILISPALGGCPPKYTPTNTPHHAAEAEPTPSLLVVAEP